MLDETAPCARCGRIESPEGLQLWTERRRLRRFADGGYLTLHRHHYHAVCEPCLNALTRGGDVQDVAARRGALTLLAVLALGAAAAALTPVALPSLKSAFWRNCARSSDCPSAPRYW